MVEKMYCPISGPIVYDTVALIPKTSRRDGGRDSHKLATHHANLDDRNPKLAFLPRPIIILNFLSFATIATIWFGSLNYLSSQNI